MSCEMHAVDLNPLALDATRETWRRSLPTQVDVLQLHLGDLFEPFTHANPPPLFDLIMFNPPYVPTDMAELDAALQSRDPKGRLALAWCGGPGGRVVLDRFLQHLPRVLAPVGTALVVILRQNDLDDVVQFASTCFGGSEVIRSTVVASRYTGESLCILRVDFIPRTVLE